MIRAVIFDFFGVLTVDPSMELKQLPDPQVAQAVAAANRASDLGQIEHDELMARLAAATGRPEAQIRTGFDHGVTLNQDLLALVDQVHQQYKTGLLSNAGHTSLDPYISKPELAKYFDVVVLSANVGLVKPDPTIYQLICKRLDVEPTEAIFIDDVERYAKGGEGIGLRGIHFLNIDQLRAELGQIIDIN